MIARSVPVPQPTSSPLSGPRLLAVAGPVEGKVFEIGEEPFPIGRQSGNRLQLHHGSVSRRHCVLERSEGGVLLRDLESRCGTFVNGVPVRERRLEHGDFIKVGDALFLFLSRPEEPGDAAALGGDYTVRSTIQLSLDDVFYLHPERVEASLAAGDSKARALSTLLEISAEVQTLSGVEALARRLVERAFEIIPEIGRAHV